MSQIFVDSRDRTGVSKSSTDFSICLPQTLALESGHQGRIDDFRMPMTTPTVYWGNSGIYVQMGASWYEVYLSEGQYGSGTDLANEIRSKLAASVPGAWTVTWNGGRLSMEIQCSNPFKFTGGSFMQRWLDRPHTYDGGGTYYFPYAPLQGLDVCYLCCSNFSHMDSVGPKGASDCLCSIPITVGYGAVQTYSMSNEVWFNIPALTTQQLSFQLRDGDWNIVNSVANISFTLTID